MPEASRLVSRLPMAETQNVCDKPSHRLRQRPFDGLVSAPTDWLHGRLRGHLVPSHTALAAVRSYTPWLRSKLEGIQVNGMAAIEELNYCRRDWHPHFNRDGASRSAYHIVEECDDMTQRFVDAVEALSLSLAHALAAAFGAHGFRVRAAEGMQLSRTRRQGRKWHTDPWYVGDYILTVTLEGDCSIKVERYESRRRKADAWCVVQRVGDYYAICGPSRDDPIKHCVIAGSSDSRLSLTLRYVDEYDAASGAQASTAHSERAAARRVKRSTALEEAAHATKRARKC